MTVKSEFDACAAAEAPPLSALALDAVNSELTKYAGSQFDPACVEAFLRLLGREGESFIKKDQKFDIYEFIEG